MTTARLVTNNGELLSKLYIKGFLYDDDDFIKFKFENIEMTEKGYHKAFNVREVSLIDMFGSSRVIHIKDIFENCDSVDIEDTGVFSIPFSI